MVAAKKSLGQHFLADRNMLGVIGRLAELDPVDVVLEVGPGLGVLTAFLAERVQRVHAIEIDRSLAPPLNEALAGVTNVDVVFGDALTIDLVALEPPVTKIVANLPYNIATPLVMTSLMGLPAVDLWCVMVQREVADRFFAVPSTKAYGAVSVLVQLTARRTGFHAVSREVFRPAPNVDSALVAFRRIEQPPDLSRIREVVDAAFAHRRKTIVNSAVLAGLGPRERIEAALHRIGVPQQARAESLEPGAFVALAEELA